MMNLQRVANEIGARLASIFLPDAAGRRPCHGDDVRFAADPHWRELVLFHEYFHGKPVEVWAQVTRPGGRRLWLVTSLMLRGKEVDNLVRSDSVAATEGFRSTTRSRVPPILIAYPQ